MSTREPLWFCHECHAEMRPLMVPDPVCASCRGTFVEKMENPGDDPRQFAHDHGGLDEDLGPMPPGVDALLMNLQALMESGMRTSSTSTTQRTSSAPSSFTLEMRGPSGTRTVRLGGANTLGRGNEDDNPASPIPNMTTFLRSGLGSSPNNDERPSINGAMMAQYLMALLGGHDHGLLGSPESGRMGDYVFNQEALDQVITQIMENSNAHRPVPATDEIMNKLPREVLLEGSPTLEQDCAVCKEQFKLETEDPDELVVITLPCKHPFHESCIMPWLKSSGTCPVCRFALIPQPEHHAPPPPGSSSGSGGDSGDRSPGGSGSHPPPGPGGLFHAIFGNLTGQHNTPSNSSTGGSGSTGRSSQEQRPQTSNSRSPSDPAVPSTRANNAEHLPGTWSEDLD